MQLDDYIKAGKIAAEVREIVRGGNLVGKTVYEICEEVENQIKKRGAKCAFPVNVSINEIAAHYTAEPIFLVFMICATSSTGVDLFIWSSGFATSDTGISVKFFSE